MRPPLDGETITVFGGDWTRFGGGGRRGGKRLKTYRRKKVVRMDEFSDSTVGGEE